MIETHWCWLGRDRIEVVGPAVKCVRCRRYANKHRCGARSNYHVAAVDWPVVDCAACNPPEKLVDSVPDTVPEKPVKPRDPAVQSKPSGARHTFAERRQERARLSRMKAQRRILLALGVSQGLKTAQELHTMLQSFGAETSVRCVQADLAELCEAHVFVREKHAVPKTTPFMPGYVWYYAVNPAVLSRMSAGEE